MGIVCNLIADGLKRIEENKRHTNDVLIGKCDETIFVLLDGSACFSTQLEKWCYDTDKLLDAFHPRHQRMSFPTLRRHWHRILSI